MPGLRGFSGRNLYYMKTFYEEWSNSIYPDGVSSHSFAVATAKSSADPDLQILQSQLQNLQDGSREDFVQSVLRVIV